MAASPPVRDRPERAIVASRTTVDGRQSAARSLCRGVDAPGMPTLADRLPAEFDHPAWTTGVATLLGYGVILAVMTALLFVVPWLLFSTL